MRFWAELGVGEVVCPGAWRWETREGNTVWHLVLYCLNPLGQEAADRWWSSCFHKGSWDTEVSAAWLLGPVTSSDAEQGGWCPPCCWGLAGLQWGLQRGLCCPGTLSSRQGTLGPDICPHWGLWQGRWWRASPKGLPGQGKSGRMGKLWIPESYLLGFILSYSPALCS